MEEPCLPSYPLLSGADARRQQAQTLLVG